MMMRVRSEKVIGAIAVIQAAGLKTNDFLTNDGLNKGNHLIAGNESVYAELEKIYFG